MSEAREERHRNQLSVRKPSWSTICKVQKIGHQKPGSRIGGLCTGAMEIGMWLPEAGGFCKWITRLGLSQNPCQNCKPLENGYSFCCQVSTLRLYNASPACSIVFSISIGHRNRRGDINKQVSRNNSNHGLIYAGIEIRVWAEKENLAKYSYK